MVITQGLHCKAFKLVDASKSHIGNPVSTDTVANTVAREVKIDSDGRHTMQR